MSETHDQMDKRTEDNLRRRTANTSDVKTKSQINAEYFQALEQWLNDVRSYRYSCSLLAGLPYAMMAQQLNGFTLPSVNSIVPPIPPFNQDFGMFTFPTLRNNYQHQQQQQQQQQQQHQPQSQTQQQPSQQVPADEGVEYTIPPFWKRFIAELVDFILLFIMKLAISLIAVDFFVIFDFDDYDFQQQQDKLDYKIALEITSKILSLEILYKFIVCLYEGIFLRKGVPNQIGGATPGKTFMGIRVVLCKSVQQVGNHPNIVKVYPATDLGFGWSFARALLKNLVLALLVPFCFPFLFNKFNRTTYDILCHSVVVEDRVQPDRNR